MPRRSITSVLAWACLALLGAGHGLAQEEPEPTEELPEVTVSAPRITEDRPVDEAAAPAFVSVIKVDDYRSQVKTLEELLEETVGVQIRRYGGLGSFSSISIRGSSGEQVLVFVDGVLMNHSAGGAVDLSTIPLSAIEFIEVYRGLTPARFGAAGMGGVVNIRTKRAGGQRTTRLKYSQGSLDTYGGTLFHSQRVGKLGVLVSFDYLRTDGDYEFLDDNATQFNTDDDETVRRENNQFWQDDGQIKLSYEFANGWRLDVSDSFFKRKQGVPGRSSNQSRDATSQTTRNLATLRLFKGRLFELPLDFTWRLSHVHTAERFDDPRSEVGLGQQDSRNVNELYSSNLNWSLPVGESQMFSLTYEFRDEEYRPHDEFALGGLQPRDSLRRTHSVSLEDEIILLDDRLALVPALRWDYHRSKVQGKEAFGERPPRETTSDDYLNAQLGLRYDVTPWLTLKGNASKARRVPSFYEMFGDRGFTIGNSELEAEESRNLDLGLRLHFENDGVLSRFLLEASVFRNRLKDLINFIYDARGVGRAENIARAEIEGLELRNSFTLGKHFRVSQNCTWQDPLGKSDIDDEDDKLLPGRAKKEYFGRAELFWDWGKLFYEISHTGRYFHDRGNRVPAQKQTLANLGLSLKYRAFTVGFEVKNLNDRDVADIAGYPLPGRSYYFTAQAEF